jgi:hypothetical protein
MTPLYRELPSGQDWTPDVGTPQANNLARLACHSVPVSDMVATGRTQAAFNSDRGRMRESVVRDTPQERWSRGCRRAHVSFWHLQWLASSPLAQPRKKKLLWLSRLRLSRNSLANTSNGSGRVDQHRLIASAPIPFLPRGLAVEAPAFPYVSQLAPRDAVWRADCLTAIAPLAELLRRQDKC